MLTTVRCENSILTTLYRMLIGPAQSFASHEVTKLSTQWLDSFLACRTGTKSLCLSCNLAVQRVITTCWLEPNVFPCPAPLGALHPERRRKALLIFYCYSVAAVHTRGMHTFFTGCNSQLRTAACRQTFPSWVLQDKTWKNNESGWLF